MGFVLIFATAVLQLAALVGLGALVCRAARVTESWVAIGWCGFATFLVVAQLAHLLVPLGSWFAPTMFAVSALGWRDAWRARPGAGLSLSAGVLVLATLAALGPAEARDNGLYFIQATLWARDFAAVPGLANLHPCLGANHAYFAWVASWAVGPLHAQPWLVANVALMTLACAPGCAAISRWVRQPKEVPAPREVAAIVLLAPLFDVLLSGQMSSPVADVALACAQAALTVWLLEVCAREVAPREWVLAALVISSLATLKAAGAQQALMLWVFALVMLRAHRRALTLAFAASALVLVPWLLNGLITSGYPLYPSPMLGLPVSWRVPEAVAQAYLNVSSAQHHALVMYDRSGALRSDWPVVWLTHHWVENRDFLIPIMLWLGGVGAALIRRERAVLHFVLPMSAALALWFVMSPELRFAQLTVWGAGAGSLALMLRATSTPRALALASFSVLLIAWSFVLYPLAELRAELPAPHVWRSRPLPLASGDTLRIGDGNFDCYDLPCVLCPYEHLRLRQPGNLGAGFARDPADKEFFECGGNR